MHTQDGSTLFVHALKTRRQGESTPRQFIDAVIFNSHRVLQDESIASVKKPIFTELEYRNQWMIHVGQDPLFMFHGVGVIS